MQELFYDGLGNPFLKPKDKKIRNRFSVYALVYIRDVDRYLFINPIPNKTNEFFKLVGGGIKDGEDKIEALTREFMEEIGYPVNDSYIQKDLIEYKVSFKPLRDTDEYWYNNQSIYLFEIEKFKDSLYPSVDKWILFQTKLMNFLN